MGISIDIVAGPDEHSSSVKATGKVWHVITDQERATFKLTDDVLKWMIYYYFEKKSPEHVYLHGPTPPYGDMYAGYNWQQVVTILQVESAQILGITSEPVILGTKDLINDSDKRATFHADMSETINETTSSSWSTGGTLSIGETAEVSCEFLGVGAKASTSLSYSQSWGINSEKSKSVEVGTESGVQVELDPGESVIAELSSSRGVLKVRIRYKAGLWGLVAMHYDELHQGHHDWGLPIGNVMRNVGVCNEVISTEDIEIGYYTNSKVKLRNKKTNKLEATFSLADLPMVVNLPKARAGD
jgi:hypothetical protein